MEDRILDFEGLSAEEAIASPERLCNLIDEKKYSELKAEAAEIPAPDLAELFVEIPVKYHAVLFRLLSKEHAAETFVDMDTDAQRMLIESFSDTELETLRGYFDRMIENMSKEK